MLSLNVILNKEVRASWLLTATLALSACDGSSDGTSRAPPVADDEPPATVEPLRNFNFDLSVDREMAFIDEGSLDGTTIVVTTAPRGNESVVLEVEPMSSEASSDDDRGMDIDLTETAPVDGKIESFFRFRLDVSMRPSMRQIREFRIIATSGDIRKERMIALEVRPINVPDVYLLIGQSNMVGSSESGAKDVAPGGLDERSDRILQLNVTPNARRFFEGFEDHLDEGNNAIEPRYIEAEDPLHDPREPFVSFKGGTHIGPAMSFARAALAETTQSVYLVPAAWGATGFCSSELGLRAWNATESDDDALGGTWLLERALTRLRMTLRDTGGVLRGILWHQGGADSNRQRCADRYAENLQLMVERLRREAREDARGPDARGSLAPIPFIVATQSRGRDSRADFSVWSASKQKVDAAHRELSGRVPYSDWVNNDDLVPPAYPCGSNSCVHFGALANREIGQRYFDALVRIWERGE